VQEFASMALQQRRMRAAPLKAVQGIEREYSNSMREELFKTEMEELHNYDAAEVVFAISFLYVPR
jgi:hypothetical protein